MKNGSRRGQNVRHFLRRPAHYQLVQPPRDALCAVFKPSGSFPVVRQRELHLDGAVLKLAQRALEKHPAPVHYADMVARPQARAGCARRRAPSSPARRRPRAAASLPACASPGQARQAAHRAACTSDRATAPAVNAACFCMPFESRLNERSGAIPKAGASLL